MEIPKIQFNNGLKIPVLGLGTWKLLEQECYEAVKKALSLGYTHIDTAEIYHNEQEIGRAIKDSGIKRENLFITSKFWSIAKLGEYEKIPRTYNDVMESFENSIKKLQTDYLDLYLIHWPNKLSNLRELLKAFKELYDKNKIKSFGVSNFTIKHLQEIMPIEKELNLPSIKINLTCGK